MQGLSIGLPTAWAFAKKKQKTMVQDDIAAFLETLDRFEGRSQVRTWPLGIFHHKVMERRRDQYRDQQSDPIDEVFESRFDTDGNWMRPPQDLEQLLASHQIGQAIKHCLGTLPATPREVFVLREIEQCETGEICKILSISITNLSVLIHRARSRLRECLEARGWRKAG